jgi:hypothetical protein
MIKPPPSVRKALTLPFWDHKYFSLVDFLDHVDTVAADSFSGTYDSSRQAVRCERLEMLLQHQHIATNRPAPYR